MLDLVVTSQFMSRFTLTVDMESGRLIPSVSLRAGGAAWSFTLYLL